MPSHSAAERAALADALEAAGPHRPTLCDGWTTTELAAHLLTRERRPDSSIPMLVPALSGWSDRIRSKYATRPYADLIAAIRTGPPWTSPMALPGVDARINLIEHFVHCEDVRRAYSGDPGWTPRELPVSRQNALWEQISVLGRMIFRKSPVSVTLRTPDGRMKRVISQGDDSEGVELVGEPGELTLYAYGRKDHALVQLDGPDDAVAAFRELFLHV
jgi:uncharacterized protein (TIGR03085 family)